MEPKVLRLVNYKLSIFNFLQAIKMEYYLPTTLLPDARLTFDLLLGGIGTWSRLSRRLCRQRVRGVPLQPRLRASRSPQPQEGDDEITESL